MACPAPLMAAAMVLRADRCDHLHRRTMFLMMGEQITARGVGNGISLIIFAGIIAEIPRAIFNLFSGSSRGSMSCLWSALLVIALTVFIVFIERSQRRVLIQYPPAGCQSGRPGPARSCR